MHLIFVVQPFTNSTLETELLCTYIGQGREMFTAIQAITKAEYTKFSTYILYTQLLTVKGMASESIYKLTTAAHDHMTA